MVLIPKSLLLDRRCLLRWITGPDVEGSKWWYLAMYSAHVATACVVVKLVSMHVLYLKAFHSN